MTPHVKFIINSQLPSVEELIERLDGVSPDKSWSRGETQRSGPAEGWRDTGAVFRSPINPEVHTDVVVQVHALLERLEPIRDRLVELKHHCLTEAIDLKLRVTYFHFVPFATVAWLELGLEDLKRVSSFGAEFDSEYIWRTDSDDPTIEWDEDPNRGFFDEDHWHWLHGTEKPSEDASADEVKGQ